MKKMCLFMVVMLVSLTFMKAEEDLFRLTIVCPDNYRFRMEYTQMIADEFERAGIDANVDYVSWDELQNRCFGTRGALYESGGFDVAVFDWYIGEVTFQDYYDLFHSDNSVTKNSSGSNAMSWENAENDELVDMIGRETDDTQLRDYWLEWQETFYEEQPILLIYHFRRLREDGEYWEFSHLALNLNHPVLKEKLVRQALSHLIPRQKICDLHNQDLGNQWEGTLTQAEPCAVPVDPEFYAFNASLEPYEYDPQLARELLTKAGYKAASWSISEYSLAIVVVLCALGGIVYLHSKRRR